MTPNQQAVLAESVYNYLNLRGDQTVDSVISGLLSAWAPGTIEVTAETVGAATQRLAGMGLITVDGDQLAVAHRGRNGRGPLIHTDYETGELKMGPPK